MKYSNSEEHISKTHFKEILINRTLIKLYEHNKNDSKGCIKKRYKKIDKKLSYIQLKPIPRSFREDLWKVPPEIAGTASDFVQ